MDVHCFIMANIINANNLLVMSRVVPVIAGNYWYSGGAGAVQVINFEEKLSPSLASCHGDADAAEAANRISEEISIGPSTGSRVVLLSLGAKSTASPPLGYNTKRIVVQTTVNYAKLIRIRQ